MTPPAVKGHFSRTPLNALLYEEFSGCPEKSSLRLDSGAEAVVGLGVVLTGDQRAKDLELAVG